MYFKQFLDDYCGCASYLIASRRSLDAAIVDPSIEVGQYREVLSARGFRLRYAIDTHVHADHVSGARRLAQMAQAQLCLHEAAPVRYPFHPLREGHELALGQMRLRVLHTPGHRAESISLLVADLARGPEPWLVLTGDSLLVGDVGRPDFSGGDAAAQHASLERLLGLPEWTAVCPGHFEGPCGSAMSGPATTTVGYERRYNPLARLGREPFVAALLGAIPARPLNMAAIEATNRGVADLPWAMPVAGEPAPALAVDDLEEQAASGALLLDVREPEEYRAGHIPGACNLPAADLATRLRELPRDRPLVVICRRGVRSRRAALFLKRTGFGLVADLAGGTDAWLEAGKPLAETIWWDDLGGQDQMPLSS